MKLNDSEWNFICYAVSVVVMFQIQACYSRFFTCVRWEKNEDFLFDFSVDFNFFIRLEVDEFRSEMNEVEKFTITKYISNDICPGPISCTIPPWSQDGENAPSLFPLLSTI